MSATTQTAESAKQAPAARPIATNGAKRIRKTRQRAAPATPIPAERAVTASPAAKVAKAPATQAVPSAIAMPSENLLVLGLFHTFPDQGADISEAKAWMDTANAVLKQILKFPGGLTITAMPAAA